ncbi:hypothetical protein SI65_09946 [Aspergillus cristatus]|uniref:Thiolase-like protein type 1 additional C-terminal domain-containing protein n=1 Tax=Aspergillus cristatus TaxID=573508 RepID=A0A1E3B185_ASPCR|nr:hypothetical protein SI65_09946 [Aspergillus cristatus]
MPTPIIIGVADIKNRTNNAKEPAQLMLEAINAAIHDTGPSATLSSSIDSLSAVRTWTWPYDNLPALLAKRLGIQPKHTHYPDYHGGNQPAKLLDEAALRIANGESRVAVITGGEALESLTTCMKKKSPPKWTPPSQAVDGIFSPTTARVTEDNIGTRHSVGAPIHVYPLYENAFRTYRGQSIADNHVESTKLYARFSEVSAQHPYSWNYGRKDSEEKIGTVSPRNRMICFPYPLLMNAFNIVNLAAACVLTSVEYARELGIPENKWIYPRAGAGYRDADHFWNRPNFHTSPAISKSLDHSLASSGLTANDIDIFDFYSCFPIVPKLACHHLGLPIDSPKPITVLGGLTSFGGAGNNYSMHAITEITRQLRSGKGRHGLVLANGGVLSYQHAVCLSTLPGNGAYPNGTRLVDADPSPSVDETASGSAVIETYTVDFNRDNTPARAYIIGRLENGHRFVANHGDAQTLAQMASWTEEPIGKTGLVKKENGRNLFFLQRAAL